MGPEWGRVKGWGRAFVSILPERADHLLILFQEWATQRPRQNDQLAVIQRQGPCALVGCAGLRQAGLPSDEAEFGMELAPDYWGRHAYAVEIARALLAFGFGELGVRVIRGSTVSANVGVTPARRRSVSVRPMVVRAG